MKSESFFYYVLFAIIGLFVYYIITQWIHQIHKRNRYLKAQMQLLAKIASKQGVSSDEVETIINLAEKSEVF